MTQRLAPPVAAACPPGRAGGVDLVVQDGRLAVRIPETPAPLELFPPDEEPIWRVRMSPAVGFEFIEQDGAVVAYVARGPGGESTFRRFEPTEPAAPDTTRVSPARGLPMFMSPW